MTTSSSGEHGPGVASPVVIDRHFAAENAHDVAATLATYTDDVVWDDVANPACPVHVFDLRGGLITREQAWFDTANVLRQIAEHAVSRGPALVDATQPGETA